MMGRGLGACALLLLASGASFSAYAIAEVAKPYGIDKRIVPQAYLHMPQQENGPLPKLLSQRVYSI